MESVVQFPTTSLLEEFLDQVHLWNRVEGLPSIEIDRLPEGARIRMRTAARRPENVLRLVEAFGGRADA
jgi:hypothetical protein